MPTRLRYLRCLPLPGLAVMTVAGWWAVRYTPFWFDPDETCLRRSPCYGEAESVTALRTLSWVTWLGLLMVVTGVALCARALPSAPRHTPIRAEPVGSRRLGCGRRRQRRRPRRPGHRPRGPGDEHPAGVGRRRRHLDRPGPGPGAARPGPRACARGPGLVPARGGGRAERPRGRGGVPRAAPVGRLGPRGRLRRGRRRHRARRRGPEPPRPASRSGVRQRDRGGDRPGCRSGGARAPGPAGAARDRHPPHGGPVAPPTHGHPSAHGHAERPTPDRGPRRAPLPGRRPAPAARGLRRRHGRAHRLAQRVERQRVGVLPGRVRRGHAAPGRRTSGPADRDDVLGAARSGRAGHPGGSRPGRHRPPRALLARLRRRGRHHHAAGPGRRTGQRRRPRCGWT